MTNAQDKLTALRAEARKRQEPDAPLAPRTWGERAADAVASVVGSWRFITIQSALLIAWIAFNAISSSRVDPYPFILLNLLLSFQAAYTAPIIMMSQNRQSDIDRRRNVEDFDINRKAELEIETLHEKIDLLREREIAALTSAVERLTRLLEERRS
ncbi:DUF1003 domain-containing protein [Candidatus Viadribacter manganicus]|uniref:DUF1003 domain-containing protein n=1 Tax=Candidatus Viadribacter manganicus TaxID=1759059 RepID=A0A1B1AG93_9PROT|nr:DUF1003 domain-containing protein [Candidatus Viadribacter manganicus]ANP45567.1 hypothetical protein ATE48_06375 [Candidatus Viadribacter manganicus]